MVIVGCVYINFWRAIFDYKKIGLYQEYKNVERGLKMYYLMILKVP